MTEIVILAKASSRDEPYKVTFALNDGVLSIWCDCPAGEWGQLCKHKVSFVRNEKAMLYNRNQVNELQRTSKLAKEFGIYEIVEEMKGLEKEIEENKKKLKAAKAKIARLMNNGIK